MKNQIFLDEIDDEKGNHELRLAIGAFQDCLPEGNYICGCIHRIGGVVIAQLQIFVDGTSHSWAWSGRSLSDFARFIDLNLIPVLKTWSRSLTEFFQGLNLKSGCTGKQCKKSDCIIYKQMKPKSALKIS